MDTKLLLTTTGSIGSFILSMYPFLYYISHQQNSSFEMRERLWEFDAMHADTSQCHKFRNHKMWTTLSTEISNPKI